MRGYARASLLVLLLGLMLIGILAVRSCRSGSRVEPAAGPSGFPTRKVHTSPGD